MTNPFYFSNGQSADDSKQLQTILESSASGEYQEHVSQGHFADWIRYELKKDKLADRVAQCRSVQQVVDVLHLEHTPKPQPKTVPKAEPVIPKETSRQPIRDLERPSASLSDVPTTPKPPQPKQEAPKQVPQPPKPLAKQGFLERYNAKEFVIGLVIGIVLGVLIYALLSSI